MQRKSRQSLFVSTTAMRLACATRKTVLLAMMASSATSCSRETTIGRDHTEVASPDTHRKGPRLDDVRVGLRLIDVAECVTDTEGDSQLVVTVAPSGKVTTTRVVTTSVGQDGACLMRKVHFYIPPHDSPPVELDVVITAREPGFGRVRRGPRMRGWLLIDASDRGDGGLKPPVLNVQKL